MIGFLIKRPIAVTMSLIAILTLGMVSIGLLPVSLMPNIDIPVVTVQVSAPDMSARELSESVITTLRRQLMQLNNLTDIKTESRDGVGVIHMQFDYKADIDFVFIEVNEKIDRSMNDLPRELARPRVIKASATDLPAFYMTLTLKNDSSFVETDPLFPVSQSFMELSDFSEQVIAKRLEQMPQVAMIDISGQVFPELLIRPDKTKLDALGLTFRDIDNAINASKIQLGNLLIRDGEYQYSIRFAATVTNKHDIENIYIKVKNRLFQVKDFATVVEHPRKREGIVRSDGKHAIMMAVIKQADARMGDLKDEMDKLYSNFQEDYPGIEFTITRDQTRLLEYSIDNLKDNMVTGAVLAVLIVFLFMGDFRSPLLIALTVPLSLVISLLCFYVIGISINIISLAGLMLGVGMMVDNSIIVIDNITQKWEKNPDLFTSVDKGGSEVFTPMLSSVLTTCAVFLPLIFLSGIAGALFYDQAMAVTIGLLSSLVVSVTVIPVYYYSLFRKQKAIVPNRFLQKIQIINYRRVYEVGVKWVFRNPVPVLIAFILMTAGIFVMFRLVDKEKLPPVTKDDMMVYIEWNQRISPEENDRRTEDLCNKLSDVPILQRTSMCGTQQFVLSHTKECSPSEALIYFKAEKQDDLYKIEKDIAAYLAKSYPSAIYSIEDSDNIFDLIFSGQEASLTARLRAIDGKTPHPDKLNRIIADIQDSIPEVYFEPVAWEEYILYVTRPDRMALYGLDYNNLQYNLKSALNQNQLFQLQSGRYRVPVVMGEESPSYENLLDRTYIPVRDGGEIPASALMIESRDKDLKTFISGAEGNYYPLNINIPAEKAPYMIKKINKAVANSPDFEVSFSGSYFSNRLMIRELIIVLIISLLLLYFILAAQFESIVQPLIILSEVTVDIFGALFFLWAVGASINIMSLIGIIVMCGIIINDSILKIDTINRLRIDENRSLLRAIIQGGGMRIKPIIMTSLSTIFAILPFLFAGGMGADLQYPLSIALIGGMIIGTIVSLFIIPLFYYYIYRNK